MGHKAPKMQTMIEVLRCELGRSRTISSQKNTGPSKAWTPLQRAAHRNREAALLHFLQSGQSPDDASGSGESPLCIATAAGHVGIVKILCEAGADLKAATQPEGETALHIAIKNGRTNIVDNLLSYGAYLETRTLLTGETPLHYAAKVGSLATVVSLLKNGANYEALNRDGHSPAEVAFEAKHIHVAVAVIGAARGNRKLAKEKEMLLRHVEKAQNRFSMNNELIADLFEAGCDPDSTVLVEAIKRNDVSLAEMFLEKGADPNRPTAIGIRPIFAALNCSSAQMVRSLVKHKADASIRDTDGLTVLQAALESPSVHDKDAMTGIFEALLSNGADPRISYTDGKTLLHHAVKQEHGLAKVAQLLLQHGVKANAQDNAGCTALHYATQSRACVEVLLKHGAKANLANYAGLTPLLYAVTFTTKETESDLDPLIKTSNLRSLDSDQKTALHIAAQRGLERTVRSLLKHRAVTTLIDSENLTPLLLAAKNHQWPVVRLLATQLGVNSWDKAGRTALHIVAMSSPQSPATWEDIARTTGKFCERGVSRSMRDRSGATPLIEAVKRLPEDGLSVIEVLLNELGAGRGNCVSHEDHKQRSALYFAATLEKPAFVAVLLKHGAAFNLRDWTPKTLSNKPILKLFAEHEWTRRARMIQRHSLSQNSALPKILPIEDLLQLLDMGLDPNGLPETGKGPGSLLWITLNQTLLATPPPRDYLCEVLVILLDAGADPNACTFSGLGSPLHLPRVPPKSSIHPLAFLIEENPKIDIDILTLFLDKGAKLDIKSSFYDGCFPLHSAVKANRIDVVEELLARRAEVNSGDEKSRTAIFIAAKKGYWEIVDVLLGRGVDMGVKSNEGETPLHAAAAGGSAKIVSALLRAGMKALAKNKAGKTAAELLPEDVPEKEKEKMEKLFKAAEMREKEEEERGHWQREKEAMLNEKEKRQKEKELQQQQEREPERERMRLSPGPLDKAVFASQLSSMNSSPDREPKLATKVEMSKQTAQVKYTPSSPKPSLNISNPLPKPRIDSGFGRVDVANKPLPVLNRNKAMFRNTNNESEEDAKEQPEFVGWLAMSKMLDRL